MPLPSDSSSPSDKTNYSVQDMMDRLRHEGGSGGSRRRRSVQQKVETKKRRRVGLVLTFVAIGLVLCGIVVFQMLNRARIEGEIFRLAASKQLSALIGAEVNFDRFSPLTLTSISTPNLQVKSTSGIIKDGLAKNLSARMSSTSFWRDEWDIQTLILDEAHLGFRPFVKSGNEPSASPLLASDSFRMGLSASPAALTVHDLQCPTASISWPGSGEKVNRLQGMAIKGSFTEQTLKIQGSGGRWTGGIWADVPVENISLTCKPDGLEIDNIRFRLAEKSQVRASGTIAFTPEGPSGALDVKIDSMPLQDLLNSAWQGRLHGKYTPGSARYTINPGGLDEFSGDFTMDGLIISDFPGLMALTKFFKSELYSKLEFRQFSGHFRRTNDSIIIDEINAIRHGECKLTGNIEVKRDGTLTGNLRLALNTIESNLPQFSGEEDGLDLIDFTLSGTEADPKDSLSEKFPAPPEPPADK